MLIAYILSIKHKYDFVHHPAISQKLMNIGTPPIDTNTIFQSNKTQYGICVLLETPAIFTKIEHILPIPFSMKDLCSS